VRKRVLQGSDSSSNFLRLSRSHFHHVPQTRGEGASRGSENGLTDVIIEEVSQRNGVIARITATRNAVTTIASSSLGSSYTPARQHRAATQMANELPNTTTKLYAAHDTTHAMEAQHAALIDAIQLPLESARSAPRGKGGRGEAVHTAYG